MAKKLEIAPVAKTKPVDFCRISFVPVLVTQWHLHFDAYSSINSSLKILSFAYLATTNEKSLVRDLSY